MHENIQVTEADSVCVLTLNRASKLNALNQRTIEEILDAFQTIHREKTARVLVITGAGRGFCSGADLTSGETGRGAGRVMDTHFNPLLERLLDLPLPVVTAVNGGAAGGGCSLALAGDFVLAARSAYFLQAFVNIGLVPDVGATWILPRLIGNARATAMMMLGERVDAATAEAWGMVYRAVDDADLMGEAMALAKRLAAGPTMTYSLIRKGVRRSAELSLTEVLKMERDHQDLISRTHDGREGTLAFIEKRKPNFQGR